MASKIQLPPSPFVSKWNEEKVIKWLKRVHLEDCVSAFEHRKIDGQKLLELTEQKLFTYQDVKIKHRLQIVKCVNECKSQASNAQKVLETLKRRRHSRNKLSKETNGECEYDSEDSDGWGSDFDDEFEYEYEYNTNGPELPSTDVCASRENKSPSIISEKNEVNNTVSQLTECSIPAVSKSLTLPTVTNSKSNIKTGIYPRPPLKRPPSQPPPPPVPRLPSQETLEEYEIPISHQNNSDHLLLRKCSLPEHIINLETYEFIQPSDESYRSLENPPVLLPRNSISSMGSPPPPIPVKPEKLKISTVNNDAFRSINRPKLPIVDDSSSESSGSLAILGTNFVNSLLGRRSSTPSSSPRMHRSIKDLSGNFSSADSQSSRSSSPEKDGMFVVGSSAFITSASSSCSSDTKSLPNPSKPNKISLPDDVAQNLASRPLPPVPNTNSKDDIYSYPWFHEIERTDAESKVRNLGINGAFVVRPSKRAGKENPFSVTVLYDGKIFHLNIRLRSDNTFALGKEKVKEKTFPSAVDLIGYHRKEKILLTSRGESAGQTVLLAFPEK